MAKTYVSTEQDFPTQKHWAILIFRSIYIPGDERSRTHPGHGYPETSHPIVEYVAFDSEDEWKAEIERLEKERLSKEVYRAVLVDPQQVTTEIKINVGS